MNRQVRLIFQKMAFGHKIVDLSTVNDTTEADSLIREFSGTGIRARKEIETLLRDMKITTQQAQELNAEFDRALNELRQELTDFRAGLESQRTEGDR